MKGVTMVDPLGEFTDANRVEVDDEGSLTVLDEDDTVHLRIPRAEVLGVTIVVRDKCIVYFGAPGATVFKVTLPWQESSVKQWVQKWGNG